MINTSHFYLKIKNTGQENYICILVGSLFLEKKLHEVVSLTRSKQGQERCPVSLRVIYLGES